MLGVQGYLCSTFFAWIYTPQNPRAPPKSFLDPPLEFCLECLHFHKTIKVGAHQVQRT